MLPGALLDEAELRNTAAADADTGSLAQPADDAMAVTATSTIGTSFRKADPQMGSVMKKGHAMRQSRMSAYDGAYIVTLAQVKQFRRNAFLASFGYSMSTTGYITIGVVMAFSLNFILNGSPDSVSPESSSFLSVSVFAGLISSILVQEFWGRSGGWFGRQKVLSSLAGLALIGAALALIGHILRIPQLWIASSALIGLSGASFASASSYCADMSTADNFAMTTGVLSGFGAFGVVLGLVAHAAFSNHMSIALAIGTGSFCIALFVYAVLLPDVSPPLSKREVPTKTGIAQAFVVCSLFKTFMAQTRYTQFLLASIFSGGASFGCMRVWIFGYGLIRFGVTAQSIGILLVCTLAGGGFIVILGSRLVPAKLGCNLLMWSQILCSLIATVGPGVESTLWISFFMSSIEALSGSFLNSMYFGQRSGKRRGELSALHSVAEKVGNMVGLFVITPIMITWLQAYMTTGVGTRLTPPMAQLMFDVICVFFYYSAQLCLRHQDKFGLFVLRTSEEVPADAEAGHKDDATVLT